MQPGCAAARQAIASGRGASVSAAGMASDHGLSLSLRNSDTTAILVPTTVTIPANQTSSSFPVAAVYDSKVTGAKLVTVEPVILVGGSPFAAGHGATILVNDVDGPTLRRTGT